MPKKLGLEESLRQLARARRVKANRDHPEPPKIKPAHRSDVNEEFGEPPFANTALCIGILIALALIDWFAVRYL